MKNLNEAELLAADKNIVDALLEAADYKQNYEERTIPVERKGKVLFTFRVTGIGEDLWYKCRRENLRKRGGREELDNLRFISQAVYTATVAEDKKIWDNREIWEKLNVASGTDVVNAVLLPGEKLSLINLLEELSGYNSEIDELIKN